jgi:hypothetical protein
LHLGTDVAEGRFLGPNGRDDGLPPSGARFSPEGGA